jgi:hypothetical protein
MIPHRLRRTVFAVVAILLVGAAVAVGLATSAGDQSASAPAEIPVYRMEADHAVYPNVGDVTGDAPVVVTGKVLGHTVELGESPGVDALGDPLPAIPHTNYSIGVLTVFKGSVSAGSTLIVSLSGGTTPDAEFVLDGAPDLHDGDIAMFFLESVAGKYFPLAGGAAVASQAAGGDFEMSSEATGVAPISVSEAAVEEATHSQQPPPPPVPPVTPAAAPQAAPPAGPARKRCRQGFKRKKVKGKVKCVKKHRKARRHAKHHG